MTNVEKASARPVLGEPEMNQEWDETKECLVNTGVGWSLSWGCQLTFGYDYDGNLCAVVNMSDDDLKRGITSRTVTREQVRAFAEMLLRDDIAAVPWGEV